jgi:monofunctional glycosyltransferase
MSQNKKKSLWQSLMYWRGRIVSALMLLYLVGVPFYALICRYILPPLTWGQTESMVAEQRSFRRDYIPLSRMSPYLPLAVIAAEDGKFATHGGFDWEAIKEAWANQRGGGSTISQQAAKNVFLTLDSNWMRKALEVYPTFWIEKLWGKRRILEVYLNVVEFERGVWGVEAAAQKYFGRSAANLTRSQAAWLAVCLPNPKGCLSERRRSGRLDVAHRRVLREMNYVQNLEGVRQVLGDEYLEVIEK